MNTTLLYMIGHCIHFGVITCLLFQAKQRGYKVLAWYLLSVLLMIDVEAYRESSRLCGFVVDVSPARYMYYKATIYYWAFFHGGFFFTYYERLHQIIRD